MGGKTKATDSHAKVLAEVMSEGGQLRSLADRIWLLFERIRRPDGEAYSLEEVADWMGVSRQALSNLRTGKQDNPTRDRLQALADFFEVPPAYFFDDKKSQEIVQQIETATALRHGPLRTLALELLRKTAPDDVELVAELVRALAKRPDLREVVEVALTLESPQLQLGADLLRSVQKRTDRDREK